MFWKLTAQFLRATLYRLIEANAFPRQVSLTESAAIMAKRKRRFWSGLTVVQKSLRTYINNPL
ncbi:AlpA family phage regulatory protein [Enterobacter cloacae complex sp. 279F5]|uniref:AlpA family phage regulatory protein n=1 Tax=Enterobacter cloacae complex sp. 279F5 TaxID=3395874 RepID=UPI003CE906FD